MGGWGEGRGGQSEGGRERVGERFVGLLPGNCEFLVIVWWEAVW